MVLQTKRLTIKARQPGDGKLVHEAVAETFNQLHRWLPWAKKQPNLAETEIYARRTLGEFHLRTKLDFGIYLRDQPDKIVGCIGVFNCDWELRAFELGYWCRKSQQGNGYITESASHITYMLEDLCHARRITIRCDARNKESAAVPKRLGFKCEGLFKKSGLDSSGRPRDTLVFAKVL